VGASHTCRDPQSLEPTAKIAERLQGAECRRAAVVLAVHGHVDVRKRRPDAVGKAVAGVAVRPAVPAGHLVVEKLPLAPKSELRFLPVLPGMHCQRVR
jgi:hypothetical protein